MEQPRTAEGQVRVTRQHASCVRAGINVRRREARWKAKKQRKPERDLAAEEQAVTRLFSFLSSEPVCTSLLSIFPVVASDGTLQCSNCQDKLTISPVGYHACQTKWTPITLTPDLVNGKRCRLCSKFACCDKPHLCRALSRLCYDLTAFGCSQPAKQLWPGLDERHWGSMHDFDAVRGMHGMWVCVFPAPHSAQLLCRHHIWVGNSSIPGAGVGAFTIGGTLDRACPAAARKATAASENPCLSTSIVGQYTGTRVLKTESPSSWATLGSLSAIKLPSGTLLEPLKHGSVTYFLNCGHGTKANVINIAGDAADHVMCFAASGTPPGGELLWDYEATTTDASDGALNVSCNCGGERRVVKIAGGMYTQRACTHRIMQLREQRGMKRWQ